VVGDSQSDTILKRGLDCLATTDGIIPVTPVNFDNIEIPAALRAAEELRRSGSPRI
jgi:hypothetical protein